MPVVPKSPEELLKPILDGITDKTKMMVISQVSFMNGEIFPIREIVKAARAKNIPVIVDGAHAFVQYSFDHTDLDCDFFGTSLHKWLMAPIGTGMLYIRKNRIKEVWPLMAANPPQDENIRKFEEIGTHPAANHNAIGEAINFHETIGMHRKEARLRYLRHRWTDRLRDEPKVKFYTSLDPQMFMCHHHRRHPRDQDGRTCGLAPREALRLRHEHRERLYRRHPRLPERLQYDRGDRPPWRRDGRRGSSRHRLDIRRVLDMELFLLVGLQIKVPLHT